MDRSELNRALAKAVAFKQCGKDDEAQHWARELIKLLELEEILMPVEVVTSRRY
jgi:hypothetical protein